jgi:hypothetical protein
MVDSSLRDRERELARSLEEVRRSIKDSTNRQAVLRDSTDNSEKTMNRLLELQKLNLQKGVSPSEAEQEALAESEKLFLETQRQYQAINDRVSDLNEQRRGLESDQRANKRALEVAVKPAQAEYQDLRSRHRFWLGFWKLLVLVPLLTGLTLLTMKHRTHLYAPILYAAGIATTLKVLLVMHEHFPPRYFKYILILLVLALALFTLIFLLRMVAFPEKSWLLKQYREAYERFLCPICSFPIRRGPLRYFFWNRRTVKRLAPRIQGTPEPDQPYICPVCSTRLFEECPDCQNIRAALLPACSSCGSTTAFAKGSGKPPLVE